MRCAQLNNSGEAGLAATIICAGLNHEFFLSAQAAAVGLSVIDCQEDEEACLTMCAASRPALLV
jgi:hypothetical protein